MGYHIFIGQAIVQPREDDDTADQKHQLRCIVARKVRAAAPAFPHDEPAGRSNARYPSYTGWANFTERVGLRDFFFHDQTGVMRHHPGCFQLTENHAARIQEALHRWQSQFPLAVPMFRPRADDACEECEERTETADTEEELTNADLARLMWLDDWVRWALNHCSTPAIYNT